MERYEYICKDCELVCEIEKPKDRKGEHSICPSCHGVLTYTGYTIRKEKKPKNNIFHLADYRLSKKGLD